MVAMMTVYADSMFLLNFIIDYLLLLATGRICALRLIRWRMLLGAAWGGVYAVLTVLWPSLFALPTVKLFSGAVVVLTAFGGLGKALRSIIVFFAVSAAFGGAVYAALSLGSQSATGALFVPVSMKVLLLSFAICYAALSLVFKHRGKITERCVKNVEVELGEKRINFHALQDTGNELCDPISGQKVLLVEKELLKSFFPQMPAGEAAAMLLELSAAKDMAGRFRLLPFSSIGGKGVLLCFRPDKVWIDGHREDRLVAFAEAPLSPQGDYQGIF